MDALDGWEHEIGTTIRFPTASEMYGILDGILAEVKAHRDAGHEVNAEAAQRRYNYVLKDFTDSGLASVSNGAVFWNGGS